MQRSMRFSVHVTNHSTRPSGPRGPSGAASRSDQHMYNCTCACNVVHVGDRAERPRGHPTRRVKHSLVSWQWHDMALQLTSQA